MAALVLLTALIAVPIAEIAVLIEVGSVIGTLPTVVLIILTAIAGTALIRYQGLGVVAEIREGIESDAPTLTPVVDGLFLLIAGLLLLTPGFITDAVGFIFLVPPLRRAIAMAAWRWFATHGRVQVHTRGHRRPSGGEPGEIEGEFIDLGTRPGGGDKDGDSPWRPGGPPRRS